jgi:hypothetical protein
MVAEVQADELMIQDLIAAPADGLASYRLIAEVFDLRGNAPHQVAAGSSCSAEADAR